MVAAHLREVCLLSPVVAAAQFLEPPHAEPRAFERVNDGAPFRRQLSHHAGEKNGLRVRPRRELGVR
jgi:hypothetical protein